MKQKKFFVLHLCCGIGGNAIGYKNARAQHAGVEGHFESLVGIDNDPAACADFERLTGAPAVRADISSMTPAELLNACRGIFPDAVVISAPCQGNSRLLPKSRLAEEHYRKLNLLHLQALHLVVATFAARPPRLLISENVPGIVERSADILRQIRDVLALYGYRFHEGFHDCGELGGLAQHRRRWLMIARHEAQVPTFVYQPPAQRVRAIGEVLEALPLPNDPRGGPLHRLPRLKWKTWERLAYIPAGKDWRALGVRDDGKTPFSNSLRIVPWTGPAGAVTGSSTPTAGSVCVADPRVDQEYFRGSFGVKSWTEPLGAVTGHSGPSAGAFSVADPRFTHGAGAHFNKFRVESWDAAAHAITGADRIGSGAPAVADPRLVSRPGLYGNHYRVERWDEAAPTVTGASRPVEGLISVADPRVEATPSLAAGKNGNWSKRPGYMQVLAWEKPSPAITGSARVSGSNGAAAVADPRIPAPNDRPDPPPVIIALDGTWHRPLTILERAALQSLPVFDDAGAPLILDGHRVEDWSDRVGNCIPPDSAEAIAEQMLKTLLVSGAGATFTLGGTGIWVSDREAPPNVEGV